MTSEIETAIDLIHSDSILYISTNKQSYIKKIKEWQKEFPDLVYINVENPDGSIYCTLPEDWFRFPIPKTKRKNNLKNLDNDN